MSNVIKNSTKNDKAATALKKNENSSRILASGCDNVQSNHKFTPAISHRSSLHRLNDSDTSSIFIDKNESSPFERKRLQTGYTSPNRFSLKNTKTSTEYNSNERKTTFIRDNHVASNNTKQNMKLKAWSRIKDIKQANINFYSQKGSERTSFGKKETKSMFRLKEGEKYETKLLETKYIKSSLEGYQSPNPVRHCIKRVPEEPQLLKRAGSVIKKTEMSPLKVANNKSSTSYKEGKKEFTKPLNNSSSTIFKEYNSLKVDSKAPYKQKNSSNPFCKKPPINPAPKKTSEMPKEQSNSSSSFILPIRKLSTPPGRDSLRSLEKSKPMALSVKNLETLSTAKYTEEVVEYIKNYIRIHKEIPATNINFYRIGKLLGKGAFGKVNMGMHKLTGKLVAIKSIRKSVLANEETQRKVMQEFNVVKLLKNPNVIRLYESFETENHMIIVMELCLGGDLLSYIRTHKRLKEDLARFAFRNLIMGLNHCHSKGVLHRDIKLENLLINSEGILKIGDFGEATTIKQGEKIFARRGTPAYIAPEVLKGKGYEGFGIDIWSAGVVLYTMLYGAVPFKSSNAKELHKLILQGRYVLKDDVSEDARDLIKRLLERNPRKRFAIPEILAHRWMRKVTNETLLFTSKETHENWSSIDERESVFSEESLEAENNEVEENNMTKSVILGPFNTTLTENSISEFFLQEHELFNKESIIKFSAKVKDIDKQYEKDNNGEIDNGIYTKLIHDSEEDSNNEEEKINSDESEDTEYIDSLPEKKQFMEFNIQKAKTIGNS